MQPPSENNEVEQTVDTSQVSTPREQRPIDSQSMQATVGSHPPPLPKVVAGNDDSSQSQRLAVDVAALSLQALEKTVQLERIIGRGGMGAVAIGRNLSTGGHGYVAVKFSLSDKPESRLRFDTEIRNSARLNIQGMLRAESSFITSQSHTLSDGRRSLTIPAGVRCFTTQYVQGITLKDAIAFYHALYKEASISDALNAANVTRDKHWEVLEFFELSQTATNTTSTKELVLHRILDTLSEAARLVDLMHRNKIVHRDIKPDNILIETTTKRPYLIDFGLSRDLQRDNWTKPTADYQPDASNVEEDVIDEEILTRHGQVLGTFAYMAPEQATGDLSQIGIAIDVFAIGAILHQIYTGQHRILCSKDRSTIELIRAIIANESTLLVSITGRAPRFRILESVINKCTAIDPKARYQSASEIARQLDRYIAGHAVETYLQGDASWLAKQRYQLLHWQKNHPGAVAGIRTFMLVVSIIGGISFTVSHYRGKELEAKKVAADKEATTRIENAEKLIASISGDRDPTLPPPTIQTFRIADFKKIELTSLKNNVLGANNELGEARVAAATLVPEKLETAKDLSKRLSQEMQGRERDYADYLAFKRSANQVPAERDPYSDDAPDQVRDAILIKVFSDCGSTLKNIKGDITWKIFDAQPSVFTTYHIQKFKDSVDALRLTHEEKLEYIDSMRKLLMSKIKEYPHHYRHQQYVRDGDAHRVENLVRLVWDLTGEQQHSAATLVPMVNALRAQKKILSKEGSAEQVATLERELLRYEEQLAAASPESAEDYYALGLVQAESFKHAESLELFRRAREISTERLANGSEVFGEVLASGLREIDAARRLHQFEQAVSRHAALVSVYDFAKKNYDIDHKFTVSRLDYALGMTIVERVMFDSKATLDDNDRYYREGSKVFERILDIEPNNNRFLVGAAILIKQNIFFEANRDDYTAAEKALVKSWELLSRAEKLNPHDPKIYYNRLFLNAVKGDWEALNNDIRLCCYWIRFSDDSQVNQLGDLQLSQLFSNDWHGANSMEVSMDSEIIRDIARGYAQFVNFNAENSHIEAATENCLIALEAAANHAQITADSDALLNMGLESPGLLPVKNRYPERFESLEKLVAAAKLK